MYFILIYGEKDLSRRDTILAGTVVIQALPVSVYGRAVDRK